MRFFRSCYCQYYRIYIYIYQQRIDLACSQTLSIRSQMCWMRLGEKPTSEVAARTASPLPARTPPRVRARPNTCRTGINQEKNDVSEAGLTLEEEAGLTLEVEIAYYDRRAKQRKWGAEQRAKAPVILGSLRQHLPAEVLKEAEELLSTGYGCECVCDLLQREQKRRALLEERPEAEDEEIESFLDTGVWRSKDELAARRAEYEAMIDRGEFPIECP
jgi:hypothetical protein